MNEIEQKLSEKVHYEIIPADDPHGWNIRILEEYPETVISFGAIKFEGEEEDGQIKFNFAIESSPDPDLTTEDLTFQEYVGRILGAVIDTSINEGTMVATDEKTGEMLATEEMTEELENLYNEYQSGTDSSEELINE